MIPGFQTAVIACALQINADSSTVKIVRKRTIFFARNDIEKGRTIFFARNDIGKRADDLLRSE
jgi:hypothetical protein